MARRGEKDKRMAILVRLSPETSKEFEKWRLKLNQDKAGFAALCIQAGMKSVIRGVAPEEAIDPSSLANIMTLMAKAQGVNLKKAFTSIGGEKKR